MSDVLVQLDCGPVEEADGRLEVDPFLSWTVTIEGIARHDLGHVRLTIQDGDRLWTGFGIVTAVERPADGGQARTTVLSNGEMMELDLTKLDDRYRLHRGAGSWSADQSDI